MFAGHDTVIARLLAEQQVVVPCALERAGAEQVRTGRPLAALLLEQGLLTPGRLLEAVAGHLGADALPELPARLPAPAVAIVPVELARSHGVAPLGADERGVVLLAVDPFREDLAHEVGFVLDREIRLVVADPQGVQSLIRQHYGEEAAAPGEPAGATGGQRSDEAELTATDLEQLAGQAPVIQLVNLILGRAVRDRASDVHFEPFANELKIRLRIDGALEEMPAAPRSMALPVTSRLKVLANLNIAERRAPQDGRIPLVIDGHAVDLRISTLPTQFGESVVLRVLDQSAVQLDLAQLGMPPALAAAVRAVIQRPSGILVVTGPTGSGKTTTLYGCLRLLNRTERKLLTIEDPVEYGIDGVMQVPVNPAAGLTFPTALRSFLRQDPDVMMVGEIRDLETARIAVQAALTGHLVLSTLHTSDAPGAVTRLVDMGIEPYLLASTLEAVLAQRLVRRVCQDCREEWTPSVGDWSAAGFPPSAGPVRPIYRSRGCPACAGTGYRGRLGLFELMVLDDALRETLVADASVEALRGHAIAGGMTTLREAGWKAVWEGATTLEEIARHL